MKKFLLLMAFASAAVVFASCNKESGKAAETKGLVLKLEYAKAGGKTRLIEAPGVTGQLKLNDGYIYVFKNDGTLATSAPVALNVTEATGAGQLIADQVPSDSRVYILGNIPSTVNASSLTTLSQLKAHVETITATAHNAYAKAMLANSNGEAELVQPNAAGTGSEVTVSLTPLYSRMELAQVKGDANIVSFDVTGVFVDSYYQSFTLDGKSSGTIVNQSSSTDFTGNIGDTGTWSSTGAAGSAVAVPGSGKSWVYHMASDALPRLVVRVSNIVYKDSNNQQQTLSDVRYITVTGYNEAAITKFERGKIYQIASLTLSVDKAALTPNPSDVTLTVKATVIDWVPTSITPVV